MIFPYLEFMNMDTPNWLKPGLYGAGAGALAIVVVGFAWGGWMTASKANEMASDKSRHAVIAALVPICLEQSKQDPQVSQTLALLKDATPYKRSDMVMEAGWATMPGSDDPNRQVATACMEKLTAQF
jgi:hypothetical protein